MALSLPAIFVCYMICATFFTDIVCIEQPALLGTLIVTYLHHTDNSGIKVLVQMKSDSIDNYSPNGIVDAAIILIAVSNTFNGAKELRNRMTESYAMTWSSQGSYYYYEDTNTQITTQDYYSLQVEMFDRNGSLVVLDCLTRALNAPAVMCDIEKGPSVSLPCSSVFNTFQLWTGLAGASTDIENTCLPSDDWTIPPSTSSQSTSQRAKTTPTTDSLEAEGKLTSTEHNSNSTTPQTSTELPAQTLWVVVGVGVVVSVSVVAGVIIVVVVFIKKYDFSSRETDRALPQTFTEEYINNAEFRPSIIQRDNNDSDGGYSYGYVDMHSDDGYAEAHSSDGYLTPTPYYSQAVDNNVGMYAGPVSCADVSHSDGNLYIDVLQIHSNDDDNLSTAGHNENAGVYAGSVSCADVQIHSNDNHAFSVSSE